MECDVATLKFPEAVRELHRKMGTTPKEEYDRLERPVIETRKATRLTSRRQQLRMRTVWKED